MTMTEYPLNELEVTYDYEAICNEFVIYKIEPPEKATKDQKKNFFYQNPLLDFPVEKLRALSSAYRKGAAYALFRRDEVNDQEIRRAFAKEYPAYSITSMYQLHRYSEEQFTKEFGYQSRILFQLLLSSVCNHHTPEFRFHNVSGQIYLPVKKHGKDWVCLHIDVTPSMQIQLRTTTFQPVMPTLLRKMKKKLPIYVISSQTMRRYLGPAEFKNKNETANLYWKKGRKGHHNTLDFLNIKDRKSFEASRCGRFSQFWDIAQKKLTPYLTATMRTHDFATFSRKITSEPVPYVSWDIMDTVQTPLSKGSLPLFCQYIQHHFPNYDLQLVTERNPQHKTLMLFHDRNYFQEQGKDEEKDNSLPYRQDLDVQGITLEKTIFGTLGINERKPVLPDKDPNEEQKTWTSALKAILPKLHTEFRIKDDLKNKRFTVFNPAEYIHTNWTYILPLRDTQKKTIFYHFYELHMHPDDNKIDISYFNEDSRGLTLMERRIIDANRSFYDSGKHSSGLRVDYAETLAGFFFTEDEPDRFYYIIRTGLFFLPACQDLKLADPDCAIPLKKLLAAFAEECQKAEQDEPIYVQELRQWQEQIENLAGEDLSVTLKTLKKAFALTKPVQPAKFSSAGDENVKDKSEEQEEETPAKRKMAGKLGKRLNAFIGRLTDGHYLFSSKSVLREKKIYGQLLGRSCHLWRPVFYKGAFDRECEAIGYTAGYASSPKSNIDKASILRVLLSSELDKPLPENLAKDYFAQLMVPYIRTSSYTVLPFPFKYLREYARYYNAVHRINVEIEEPDEADADQ